jgi:hypothetical protein
MRTRRRTERVGKDAIRNEHLHIEAGLRQKTSPVLRDPVPNGTASRSRWRGRCAITAPGHALASCGSPEAPAPGVGVREDAGISQQHIDCFFVVVLRQELSQLLHIDGRQEMGIGIDFLDSGTRRHVCISSLPRLPAQHDRFFTGIGTTVIHSRLWIHENGGKAVPDTPGPDDFNLVLPGAERLDDRL